jgi:hypothetical protein
MCIKEQDAYLNVEILFLWISSELLSRKIDIPPNDDELSIMILRHEPKLMAISSIHQKIKPLLSYLY